MAATDQTYRNQKTLDIIFGVSGLVMLATIVWMFADDFFRKFKTEQRAFRDVEAAMAQRSLIDLLPGLGQDLEEIGKDQGELEKAKQTEKDKKAENAAKVHAAEVQRDLADATYRGLKADYDSKESLFNIAIDIRDNATGEQKNLYEKRVEELRKELDAAREARDKAKEKLEEAQRARQDALEAQAEAERAVISAEDKLKKKQADVKRFEDLVKKKTWGLQDVILSMPVIDGFASPYKINQYTLSEFPIDYSFKYVTRYDRCTTCHLGMEKGNYEKKTLESLVNPPKDVEEKLQTFRTLLKGHGGKVGGIQLSDIPEHAPKIKDTWLTKERVNQFAAHPRLDLFLDANSPHPAEKFGCTSCHFGQGSATDFMNATHTPNTLHQKEEWTKNLGYEHVHFWDYPMLATRFTESTCLKCHYQVTDLIRYGNKEEAPKLLKGWRLVRDNGCFGCHEIASVKAFKGDTPYTREVGPDLRLEPFVPLDQMEPAERAAMLADKQNPPGTMRKVGPSLFRLSEKTNADWVRKWIMNPRGFREDTKMPHFYGLSTNNEEVLKGTDQEKFPAAEVASITQYLLSESESYLKGTDLYRQTALAREKQLLDREKELGGLNDAEMKELKEVVKRLDSTIAPGLKLRDERKAFAIKDQIVDGTGKAVTLPEKPKDAAAVQAEVTKGHKLFVEKGCLACHANNATAKSDKDIPAVVSEANFGPNLSRLAAKLGTKPGDEESARRWLVQWILNPTIHHPRTFMPNTHLDEQEASAVALWLLTDSEKWKGDEVPEPEEKALKELVRVYLQKVWPQQDVNDLLSPKNGDETKRAEARLANVKSDADEKYLARGLTADNMKLYVGKKSIGRLGCYGCHNVPGFEMAKPIGTPLNDWGKKDPERLAFEDIVAYVKDHHSIVPSLDGKEGDKKVEAGASSNGKAPYEEYFFDALEHQQREGFLHQKLMEPRSYDYHRDRSWDDRLRMPQFQFNRSRKKDDEDEAAYEARQRKEEAEAREAVMTFVLGLVAEPVPAKFVNTPSPDRAAEVKGREVLEKFNCGGCHQARPGVYEFKPTSAAREMLERQYKTASANFATDHVFPNHNAWASPPSPLADRLFAFGTFPQKSEDDEGQFALYLAQAVRFTAADGKTLELPAGSIATLPDTDTDLISRSPTYGGTFADLMVNYLIKLDSQRYKKSTFGGSSDARAALPPPLLREGEKTQPEWLFQFIRDPVKVRPQTILRMPKFNMSDDDAHVLVNYFSGTDKSTNPGIGLLYPYVTIKERDDTYWRQRNKEYVARLGLQKVEERAKALVPIWELFLKDQILEAERRAAAADEAAKAAKELEGKEADAAKKKEAEDARKRAEQDRDAANKQAADLKAQLEKKDFAALRKQWEESDVYASDAYRLLTKSADKTFCLNCHQIGAIKPKEQQGPPLELSFQRLRPDWTLRWIASPMRMIDYPTPMPQNYPKGQEVNKDIFDGSSYEQVQALRDVLLNLPRTAELPANRYYRMAPGGGK